MRAQCCICADLFESTQTVNIAATPCGHVFHEACLMRWMDTSSTCPSCRTQIKKTQVIKRLYFDISEEVEGDEDISRYKNHLSDLKAQMREKATKIKETEESRDNYAALLAVSESKHEEVTAKLTREMSLRDVLKADLKRVQKENDWHVQEIRELRKKAEKLHELQRVETILKGSSSDAEEMVRQYSEGGDSSIRQLSSLVTVMKREYNQVLVDKRTAKEQLSKVKQQIGSYQSETRQTKREMAHLRLELQATNKSLSEKEKENDENRRKIVHLRNALRHNKTEGSQSFIAALTEDSPNVAYSPMISPDNLPVSSKVIAGFTEEDEENKNSPPPKKPCLSPDLFIDTPVRKRRPTPKSIEEDPERDNCKAARCPRIPEIKSAVNAPEKDIFEAEVTQHDSHREEDDGPHIPPAMMSVMQKRLMGRSNPHTSDSSYGMGSVITRGFDGFGGSTTFVHPQRPPRGSFMKLGQQKKKLHSSGLKKNANLRKLLVPKCQQQIKDCISAIPSTAAKSSSESSQPCTSSSSNSVLLSASSSSSLSGSSSTGNCKKPLSSSASSRNNLQKPSLSSSFGKNLKKPSSSSSKSSSALSKLSASSSLGMFVSKGQPLSKTKAVAAPEDAFIDLT